MENQTETLVTQTNSDAQTQDGESKAVDQTQTDTTTNDQAKADDSQKAAEVVIPEKYDLKNLDGGELDSKFAEVYSEFLKENKIPQEKAQETLNKLSAEARRSQADQIEKVKSEWAESSKIDKEFGGANLEENLSVAKKGLDKFGTPELKELLRTSGLGNHPELIRYFYRTGMAVSDDKFLTGQKTGTTAPKTFNQFADKLYAT